MTAVSRLRQGVRVLFAWLRPVDEDLAAQVLPPNLLPLFKQMRRAERQHGLSVLRTLQRRGCAHPAAWQAALLHDCGKSRYPFPLWQRALVVIVSGFWRQRAAQWGKGAPRGWRRPFVIRQQHPQWSAEAVEALGGDPLVVRLIAEHAEKLKGAPCNDFEQLLHALQEADNAN
ncbi:MAG: hypothetical protein CUN49_08155 [Candidatus Thermofonsia Clade 1 bacterium]|jgi:hypothetical protein|uniref:Uncharacterized protein n=1 Tax=Candidatus Thermofonsia Clade 1 bacterium TaxID=2364210 RepID=A0A2M8PEC4_9CHLR|nr:MAG: hypothetical protein CUN49_08155 [Candidatus Thermofonsia Clade 1 bacterium]RMF49755.1 MAG: HD domain-containing protein [Chloroflexota bacterium]